MRPALTPVTLTDGSQPRGPPILIAPQARLRSYGFGWFLDPYRGHSRMWHYGDTMGFHSYIERFDRATQC